LKEKDEKDEEKDEEKRGESILIYYPEDSN
jgi:hypothetical protein